MQDFGRACSFSQSSVCSTTTRDGKFVPRIYNSIVPSRFFINFVQRYRSIYFFIYFFKSVKLFQRVMSPTKYYQVTVHRYMEKRKMLY